MFPKLKSVFINSANIVIKNKEERDLVIRLIHYCKDFDELGRIALKYNL